MSKGRNSIPDFYYPKYNPAATNTSTAIWCSIYASNSLAILILNFLLIYVVTIYVRGVKRSTNARNNSAVPCQINPHSANSRHMNYYLIFLCISQLLVGLVCIPIYVVFNFPHLFLTPTKDQFPPGSLTNGTAPSTLHLNLSHLGFNSSTRNTSDVKVLIMIKELGNSRVAIPFNIFCNAQTVFTLAGSLSGFGSGYAILTLAMNRYRAIISSLPSSKICGSWAFEGNAIFEGFLYIGSLVRVCVKKIHRIAWLSLFVVVTSLPMTIITKRQNCMLNDEVVKHLSWNQIFLLYSTIIGIIIPVTASATLYILSIRYLRHASGISEQVLSCKSSVKAHGRAIRMIVSVMSLHIVVALPLTVVNFCQSFGLLDPSTRVWMRSFADEVLNTIVSVDAWANVLIIFYYGGRFKAILKQSWSCLCFRSPDQANYESGQRKGKKLFKCLSRPLVKFDLNRSEGGESFESYINESYN